MRERLDVDAALAAGDGCPVGATRDVTASPAAAGCPVHAGAEPADGHHHALRGGGAAPGEELESARTDYDHGLNEVSAPLVEMVGRRLTSAEAADLGSADASE